MEAVSTGMPETPRLWRYGVGATVFSVLVLGAMALYARGLGSINGYMPHGHCYLWQSPLVALHVGSDTVIALSYLAISAAGEVQLRGCGR